MEIEQEQTLVINEILSKREQLRHEIRRKSLNEQFKKKRNLIQEPNILEIINKLRNNSMELCKVMTIMMDQRIDMNEEIFQTFQEIIQTNKDKGAKKLFSELVSLNCFRHQSKKKQQQ